MSVEKLAILINANGTQAVSEFKKVGAAAGKELGKAEGNAARMGAGFTKAGLGMMAAGGVMVAALGKAGQASADYALDVGKLTRLTGGSARDMSIMAHAAQQTGLDMDTLSKSIGLASKSIVSGKWDTLGIATKTATGEMRPMTDLLGDLADKLQGMSNGAEKNDLALQALGRGGMALMPMLQKGREGFAGWSEEMDRMSREVTPEAIKAAQDLKAAQRDQDAAWQGLTTTLGASVVPMLTTVTNAGTGVASGFVSLNSATNGAATNFVAISGGLLVVAGTASTAAGMVMKLKVATDAARASSAAGGSGLGMIGAKAGIAAAGIAVAAAGIAHWNQLLDENKQKNQAWIDVEANRAKAGGPKAIREQIKAAQDHVASIDQEISTLNRFNPTSRRYEEDLTNQRNAEIASTNALIELDRKTNEYAKANGVSAEEAQKVVMAEQAKQDAIDQGISTTTEGVASTEGLAETYKSLKERVNDVTSAMSDYFDEVNGNIDAEADWIESGQKLNAQLKEKGTGFSYVKGEVDLFTEAGRENLRVSQEFIEDASAFALAEYQRTGSLEVGRQKLVEVREAFIQSQMRANMSREAAEKYADQLGLIPDDVVTTWQANGLTEIELQMARVMDLAQRWQQTLGNITFASDWVNAPAATAPSGSAIATAAGSIPGAMTRGVSIGQLIVTSADTEDGIRKTEKRLLQMAEARF